MRPERDPRRPHADTGANVYVITHVASGRQYFGCTSYGVDDRWKQHCASSGSQPGPLYEAMREHGRDAFTVAEIARFKWSLDGFEYERLMMHKYGSFAPQGFNRRPTTQFRRTRAVKGVDAEVASQ